VIVDRNLAIKTVKRLCGYLREQIRKVEEAAEKWEIGRAEYETKLLKYSVQHLCKFISSLERVLIDMGDTLEREKEGDT